MSTAASQALCALRHMRHDSRATSVATGPVSRARVVVMGVCGCGKSTVGAHLAHVLLSPFVEGDRLHPPANVSKMAAGQPLNDDDRKPWLDQVGRCLSQAGAGIVVSCSALKRAYRARLSVACSSGPPVVFLHIKVSRAVIVARVSRRADHFMPVSLVDSQFDTLEDPVLDFPPDAAHAQQQQWHVITVNGETDVMPIVHHAVRALSS